MHRSFTGVVVAVAAIFLAPACDLGDVCGCTPERPEISGVLFGTVTSPEGAPVPGATVALTGGVGSCAVDGDVHVGDGTAGADGSYEAYFEAYDLEGEAVCVIARAYPPAGSDLTPSAPLELHYGDENYNQSIVVEHHFALGEPTPP